MNDYRLTIRCCYLGMFVQAVVINLAPVLFIPFREQLGLSYEQLGRLILVNFTTQVLFDLLAGAFVGRIGVRRLMVGAHAVVAMGLGLFAVLPAVLPSPYVGLLLATVVFSTGGGVLELMLSPIVNAVPSDRKAADMSLLHSFYAWGQMVVILLTALGVFLLPVRPWLWLAPAWALVPLLGAWGFAKAPLPPFVEEHHRQRLRHLIRQPVFLVATAALALAGASEIAISQWISAFAEKALRVPKLLGDLGGVCLFAAALGVGRAWFGIYGHRICIHRSLLWGAALSVGLYLTAGLAKQPAVALAACVLSGLTVSLFWPGLLSLAAARFPQAGATMFAMLAATGDLGAAFGPWMVGWIADRAARGTGIGGWTGDAMGLRLGLLAGTLFPLLLLAALPALRPGRGSRTETTGPAG